MGVLVGCCTGADWSSIPAAQGEPPLHSQRAAGRLWTERCDIVKQFLKVIIHVLLTFNHFKIIHIHTPQLFYREDMGHLQVTVNLFHVAGIKYSINI